jgi:hypothetical protein
MITVNRYSDADRQVWDDFVKRAKNGYFFFQRNYMEYHRDRFEDSSLLFHKDNKLIAILPANHRDGVLYSHQGLTYGGLMTDQNMDQKLMLDVFDCLVDYGREQDFSKLVYKAIPHFLHKAPAEEDVYALFRHGASLFRVDCSSAIDLRSPIPIDSAKRSGARKALRDGVRVERSFDFETFFSITSSRLTERYQTRPVHTAQEMQMLAERFPDNIALYAAFKEDRMVAGVLTFVDGHFAHSQYISSTEEGRKVRAVDAILSYLLTEQFVDFYYFDFGVSTVEGGLVLNDSLCRQKEEFGARTVVHYFYELTFVS